ncbi:MAG TPA: VOC family protein [Stellaceae bacterium]|nr:VOC family protein [Stellaceae bacterium]
MLDHVSLGVRDLAAARRFYDASLKPLGYRLLHDSPGALGYGGDQAGLWVMPAERPVPADEKSGLHLCFAAPSREAVEAFHQAALKAGGKDNGAPGPRPDYGAHYYAAFVIDPDGYRLEAYCGR